MDVDVGGKRKREEEEINTVISLSLDFFCFLFFEK